MNRERPKKEKKKQKKDCLAVVNERNDNIIQVVMRPLKPGKESLRKRILESNLTNEVPTSSAYAE